MVDENKEPVITISGTKVLNIVVTSASHTVEDRDKKVLYKKRI